MPKRSVRKGRKKRQVRTVRSYREKAQTSSLESNLPEEKELEERRMGEKELKALEDLRKDVDAAVAELRELATKTATKRPLLALGVAFVVGMAFGIALSRPRD